MEIPYLCNVKVKGGHNLKVPTFKSEFEFFHCKPLDEIGISIKFLEDPIIN